MSDDRQHEYVPHEWRDIAVGTRDECRDRLDAAQAEANNMAESARQNAEQALAVRMTLRAVADGALEYAGYLLAEWGWKDGYPRYARELADLRGFIDRCKELTR